jgi:hypothetical protein
MTKFSVTSALALTVAAFPVAAHATEDDNQETSRRADTSFSGARSSSLRAAWRAAATMF